MQFFPKFQRLESFAPDIYVVTKVDDTTYYQVKTLIINI
nr:MAG TPA: hypothetical protein [Caudoviricetes sp.]